MILSRFEPSAVGDIASGLILMIGFGHLDAPHAFGAVALGLLAACVIVAAAAVFPCLAAWMFNRGLCRYTSGSRMMEIR